MNEANAYTIVPAPSESVRDHIIDGHWWDVGTSFVLMPLLGVYVGSQLKRAANACSTVPWQRRRFASDAETLAFFSVRQLHV